NEPGGLGHFGQRLGEASGAFGFGEEDLAFQRGLAFGFSEQRFGFHGSLTFGFGEEGLSLDSGFTFRFGAEGGPGSSSFCLALEGVSLLLTLGAADGRLAGGLGLEKGN